VSDRCRIRNRNQLSVFTSLDCRSVVVYFLLRAGAMLLMCKLNYVRQIVDDFIEVGELSATYTHDWTYCDGSICAMCRITVL